MLRAFSILDGIIQLCTISIYSIILVELVKKKKKLKKGEMCFLALIFCVILHLMLVMLIDYTSYYALHKYIILDIHSIVVCIIIEWIFTRVIYNNITDLLSYIKGEKENE